MYILSGTLYVFRYKYSFPRHKYSTRVIIDVEPSMTAMRCRVSFKIASRVNWLLS